MTRTHLFVNEIIAVNAAFGFICAAGTLLKPKPELVQDLIVSLRYQFVFTARRTDHPGRYGRTTCQRAAMTAIGRTEENSVKINMRVASQQRDLIDRAARVTGKTRTEFMLKPRIAPLKRSCTTKWTPHGVRFRFG